MAKRAAARSAYHGSSSSSRVIGWPATREDVCEIGLRIEAVEFAGLDE
jgi:hypothetical protein